MYGCLLCVFGTPTGLPSTAPDDISQIIVSRKLHVGELVRLLAKSNNVAVHALRLWNYVNAEEPTLLLRPKRKTAASRLTPRRRRGNNATPSSSSSTGSSPSTTSPTGASKESEQVRRHFTSLHITSLHITSYHIMSHHISSHHIASHRVAQTH